MQYLFKNIFRQNKTEKVSIIRLFFIYIFSKLFSFCIVSHTNVIKGIFQYYYLRGISLPGIKYVYYNYGFKGVLLK